MILLETKNDILNYSAKSLLPRLDEDIIYLTVPENFAGLRLDQALVQLLPNLSRGRLQLWISENKISVDGLKTSSKKKVWGGEKIEVTPQSNITETTDIAEAIELDIVYEDDTLIIINKPVGMVVHPGNGNRQGTMLNGLLHHAIKLQEIPRAGIVHRLDKDTSGLLVVAKTLEAQISLVRQLQKRTIKRDYLALVLGSVPCDGLVNRPIGRHPTQRIKMTITDKGKEACTRYFVLERFDGSTLLQCSLETGRTHQIRVHLQSIGHPLVGDPVYGGKFKHMAQKIEHLVKNFQRQALHATKLELIHPQNGQIMMWEVSPPKDMNELLLSLHKFSDKNSSL
ncbi:MAG: 23S rRNA pseudouridine(1911/1915/1917) synthase RluD [Nitrosospira sp.]|nr:23S rRNA pseudouridine(1911/1915/1917) synthase RluD [Nitrosospira sp.]